SQSALPALAALEASDADVDLRRGLGGDNVVRCSALDDADVDRDSALVVGKCVEGEDLVGELLDRTRAVAAVRARVCRAPGDRQPEAAQPFARGLQVAVRRRRLDDERGGDAAGSLLQI